MKKKVAIGLQNFEELIQKDYYYIDKTDFIKEWWDCGDSVTLITRPRRFGKTLNMSMVETFFSVDYADRGELFEGLSIWEEEEYRKIQGTYSVITTTSKEYATSFGFTEEVFTALEDFGMGDLEADVRKWYDGFIFGEHRDI